MSETQKSKDSEVTIFLENLESTDSEKFTMIKLLREVVFEVDPDISEKIMYGGIMFTANEDFGGIFVSQKHVSFGFSKGAEFVDPQNI